MSARAELGKRAEDAAADYLVAAGYTLLGRNVRLGALEIDIVAQRGAVVAVVEVRARGPGSFVGALASITPRKRMLLVRATRALWRKTLRAMSDVERVRIDVAAVTFDAGEVRVEHIEGAIVDE